MQRPFTGRRRFGVLAVLAALGATVLASGVSASGTAVGGSITADGSSTVGPWTTAAAELFQRRNRSARVTVGVSGTGGGFERFCRGEIDLANASRPISQSREVPVCSQNNIKYVAFTVANDGLAVVVNRSNTWANCLTTAELKRIWEPGSRVNNWSQVRAGFPDVPLRLFGAGTDSGTFDFFTEKINGRARASRSDYSASEDDNVLVTGVSGERGGMGYFGLSYYVENRDRLKVLQIDGGNGCVAPNTATVQSVRYKPLSRPLFIYAKRTSFQRPVVAAFIGFALNNQKTIATRSRYVPLTDKQAKKARYQYRQALKAQAR
jgi:phosphate transport system substrate-binding protein